MDVTTEDVKAADVIWGQSVLKMKGNTVRRNGKCMAQSIVKVPKELIKLQQDVELAIDCFLSINTSSSPLGCIFLFSGIYFLGPKKCS